jgi:hypothetical protein
MVTMVAKWSSLLSRPVPLADVRIIRMLTAGANLAFKNKASGKRNSWREAARLLMVALLSRA